MKRIVRHKTTRQYLSDDGTWATHYRSARDFENVESAIFEVQKLKLKNVELVLVMGKTPSDKYDVSLSFFAPRSYDGDGKK